MAHKRQAADKSVINIPLEDHHNVASAETLFSPSQSANLPTKVMSRSSFNTFMKILRRVLVQVVRMLWRYCLPIFTILCVISLYLVLDITRQIPSSFKEPVRILLIADPQVEGNDKIHNWGWLGRQDLWWSNLYLSALVWRARIWVRPTHVFLLGDMVSSEWISTTEFDHRAKGLYNDLGLGQYNNTVSEDDDGEDSVSQEDRTIWTDASGAPVITIPGNHDTGYESGSTAERLHRFQAAFGPSEGDELLHDTHYDEGLESEEHQFRVVWLNSMLAHKNSWKDVIKNTPGSTDAGNTRKPFTVLLSHIPLWRQEGICVDQPEISMIGKRIRTQTLIAEETSQNLLSVIDPDIVLSGHDHEGCHVQRATTTSMTVSELASEFPMQKEQDGTTHEYILRSIMGDYHGAYGILTIDPQKKTSRFWRATSVHFVVFRIMYSLMIIFSLGAAVKAFNRLRHIVKDKPAPYHELKLV